VIWFYKGQEYRGVADCPLPKVVVFNEANDEQKTWEEIYGAGATLVMFHHVNDLRRWEGRLRAEQISYAWCPHATDCQLFAKHCRPWDERMIDVLVTGTLSPETYPLRCRLASLVRERRLPGRIHPHPGYRLKSLEQNLRQRHQYAVLLGNAKAAAVCSSTHKYGLAKYVEAAAAGCCVVGDAPPDYEPTLGPAILDVEGLTDGAMARKVATALESGEARRLARLGQKIARRKHSISLYSEGFASMLRAFTKAPDVV
jgi:hypothetical protein